MAVKAERRRKHLVDLRVQGALLRQLVCYWVLGSVALLTFTMIYRIAPHWLTGGGDAGRLIWRQLGPVLLTSAAVGPIVFVSAIRFSNRFVGPMLRFRRALRHLADGQATTSISLRERDYWQDIAADINRLIAAQQLASPPEASSPASAEQPPELVPADAV